MGCTSALNLFDCLSYRIVSFSAQLVTSPVVHIRPKAAWANSFDLRFLTVLEQRYERDESPGPWGRDGMFQSNRMVDRSLSSRLWLGMRTNRANSKC